MGVSDSTFLDSTGEITHSTFSYESERSIQGVEHHRHQYQDNPPPAYTEYTSVRPQLPLSTSSRHLQRPVVIPATTASLGSPFLRAYPPGLEAVQISREDFLGILDGLNRVAVQSPPLRALGLVGQVLEAVPLPTVQITGFAINSAAQIGKYALSKGATEAYLRKVNKETFAPRGLVMEIAKLEAMARVNGLPILDATGKINHDAQLLQPLLDAEEMQTIGAAQRWLQALGPWVEPLELEAMPPINTDISLWGRLHTAASEHERRSSEKKILKDRSKAFEKHEKGVSKAEEKRTKDLARLERRELKVRDSSSSHRVESKLQKIDQKREKAEMKHHERMEKTAEKSKDKDKEAKAMTKVLWLIIRDADKDSDTRGVPDVAYEEYPGRA